MRRKLYTLETKDGLRFHAKSHMYAYGLDGTDFGYSESTTGDYYKYLIESKNEQIHAIEERYHITFVKDNNGIITAVHHNDYDIEIHMEGLEKIAPAISELKEIIKPTEAYASNIHVVEREYPTRRTDWYYLFAGEESLPSHTDHNGIGPYNHQDEFYAYQETSPEILNYTHQYIDSHYSDVEYLDGGDQFIRDKVLFCVDFNSSDRYEKVYVDVTHFNALYEQYKGKIPQEKFDQIVFENDFMTMDDIIKYVPYAEKNK